MRLVCCNTTDEGNTVECLCGKRYPAKKVKWACCICFIGVPLLVAAILMTVFLVKERVAS